MPGNTVTTTAVLTGAGSGTRLGAAVPKALVPINGVPMVRIAAHNLLASGIVDQLIVTVPAGYTSEFTEALRTPVLQRPDFQGANFQDANFQDAKLPDAPTTRKPPNLTLVTGGETRQQSIAKALQHVNPNCTKVLVHDAARPFTPPNLIAAVAAAVTNKVKAAIPAQPVTDTIKQTEGSSVMKTLDRSSLVSVQTPQGFDRETLETAYRHAIEHQIEGTDDASLVEALGIPVIVIPGHAAAMKITTPTDLQIASILFDHRRRKSP